MSFHLPFATKTGWITRNYGSCDPKHLELPGLGDVTGFKMIWGGNLTVFLVFAGAWPWSVAVKTRNKQAGLGQLLIKFGP